ncbi:MAG: DUF4446 family protein [Candidatus Paceibacterota bacterium]
MEFAENITPKQLFFITGLLILVAYTGLVILFLQLVKLNRRIKSMLGGSKADNIEDSLKTIQKKLTEYERSHKDIKDQITSLENRVKRSIQGVETIRFNPFKGNGGGGNQSFTTSFIDESGDGVVISSLYSRERVSIYAKPVNRFVSEHNLSEEEKEVLARAEKKVKGQDRDH